MKSFLYFNESRIKYFGLAGVFCLSFLYLICVVYKLQVKNHEYYFNQRSLQNSYSGEMQKRGTIFSTRKDGQLVPIAEDEVWYRLTVSPKLISSFYEDRVFELVNKVTPVDRASFYSKVKNKKDSYEELKIISKLEAETIEKMDIQGVQTAKIFKRKYSLGEVAGRVVGFVGGGATGFEGKYGLEKFYQSDLTSGKSIEQNFFSKIFNKKSLNEHFNSNFSKDIVTSLEPNVMKFLFNLLSETKENWSADEVSAIVMKVDNGEIVAMETVPEFDPNRYQDYAPENYGNLSVQGVYELGSIMKPITMSGGIEAGLVTPASTFNDKGFVKIDNYTIKNFDEKIRGIVTMQDVISQSLNTGAVYVQQLLGKKKFKENYIQFGLDEQTGIDFPGELSNQNGNLDTDTDVNFATASFGQGVAITPISMLNSLNIIPNRGKVICPHFLIAKKIEEKNIQLFDCEKGDRQVVSTSTAATVKQMMVELIDTGLAHGRYKDKNYKVGAKTGTAQLPSPDGKYYKDKFIHSYFTFFPAKDPKFAVLIYQVNPKRGLLASLTLAPVATKIKDFMLMYYNVPPDRN